MNRQTSQTSRSYKLSSIFPLRRARQNPRSSAADWLYFAYMGFEKLPGHDLIERGLEDLSHGCESVPALLVSIGAVRLRAAGIPVPENTIPCAEIRLYEKLRESGPDEAHSRYNALIRTLVSFERAAECVS